MKRVETDDEVSALWDEIGVDSHKTFIASGREEGMEAGLQAGFNEGKSLGQLKALELGIELGFILGFVSVAKKQTLAPLEARGEQRVQKIRENLQDLEKAIRSFPAANEIFQDARHEETTARTETSPKDKVSSSGIDVAGKLQRIRAKFKLITVQLKIPNFSISKVLEQARQESVEESNLSGTGQHDRQLSGKLTQSTSGSLQNDSLEKSTDW